MTRKGGEKILLLLALITENLYLGKIASKFILEVRISFLISFFLLFIYTMSLCFYRVILYSHVYKNLKKSKIGNCMFFLLIYFLTYNMKCLKNIGTSPPHVSIFAY